MFRIDTIGLIRLGIGLLGILFVLLGLWSWHYRPIHKLQNECKTTKKTIIKQEQKIKELNDIAESLKVELELCNYRIQAGEDMNTSNIKDTENEGYFIF